VDLNLVHAGDFHLANVGEWGGRVSYLLGFAARIPRLLHRGAARSASAEYGPVRGI